MIPAKKILKQATDSAMPNIEYTRQRILSNPPQKARIPLGKKLVPIMACFAIVVIGSLLFFKLPFNQADDRAPAQGIQKEEMGGFNDYDWNQGIVADEDTKPANKIHFNSLGENSIAQHKLYFDPQKTYTKELSLQEVFDYLGKDIRPTVFPQELTDYAQAYPNTKYQIIYNNDGTVAYDQFAFSYLEEASLSNYNPLAKNLTITVSKENNQKCCVYSWEKEMEPSILQGQELMLGKRKMGYGPYTVVEDGPNTPAGYYDLLVAEFEQNSIYFEIVAENLTEEEFLETITSIIENK